MPTIIGKPLWIAQRQFLLWILKREERTKLLCPFDGCGEKAGTRGLSNSYTGISKYPPLIA